MLRLLGKIRKNPKLGKVENFDLKDLSNPRLINDFTCRKESNPKTSAASDKDMVSLISTFSTISLLIGNHYEVS